MAPELAVNLRESIGTLARWRLRLSEFEFGVVHRASVKRQAGDALPRLPTSAKTSTLLEDDQNLLVIEAIHSICSELRRYAVLATHKSA